MQPFAHILKLNFNENHGDESKQYAWCTCWAKINFRVLIFDYLAVGFKVINRYDINSHVQGKCCLHTMYAYFQPVTYMIFNSDVSQVIPQWYCNTKILNLKSRDQTHWGPPLEPWWESPTLGQPQPNYPDLQLVSKFRILK